MIVIKDLKKIYHRANIIALDCINVNIGKKEIVGILGPNGSGKTTLVKCICGLLYPDFGEIELMGVPLNKNNKNLNDISVVLEGARNIYWKVAVRSNYYYFGALKGKSRKEIDKAIDEYNELFNTTEFIDRKVETLSMGQKQRVSILSSILTCPQVLILDEPSNSLDIESKITLAETLRKIRECMETTIIVTSHDLDFIKKVVDRLIIINKGKVVDSFDNKEFDANEIEDRYRIIVDNC